MKIKRVLFIGSKLLGLKSLQCLHSLDSSSLIGILTIDDRSDSRSVFSAFEQFAHDHQIPLFIAKDRKNSEEIIVEAHPELCVVIGWYWIISKKTLAAVPQGVIGVHNSQLPRYRGGAPLVWAIIHGETHAGVSLFSLGEGMDDGDIWDQRTVEIGFSDYISDVLDRVDTIVLDILNASFLPILNQSIRPRKQVETGVSYGAQRSPEDGLIDWRQSSIQVYNFIRAQSAPYPGAFTWYNGKKLTIWRAEPLDLTYFGTPGQVATIDQHGVCVICGDQKPILLKNVGYDADRDVPAQDVLTSIKIRLGHTAGNFQAI